MEPLHIPWWIFIVWIVNFGISWWNAYAAGVTWVETRQIGGWQKFMNWMAAIMSGSGFTWCYLLLLVCGFYYAQPLFLKDGHAPLLNMTAVEAAFSLGYLIIIPGVLFAGLMIWIDSLVQAWKRRDALSVGAAAWNSYAEMYNTYSAYSGVSGAFESLSRFLGKDGESRNDDDGDGGAAVILVLCLVGCALLGGVVTTWVIISHYAGSEPLPQRNSWQSAS